MTVIDHQCHWYPESFFELVAGRERYPRVERADGGWRFQAADGIGWTFTSEQLSLERYFERLDAAGSDVGVSSPNMVADVTKLDVGEAREITQLLNEETARVQREHGERFIGLAMLPMQDVGAAIETLDDAILRLGLRGVCVLSNIAGASMGTAETLPLWRRVEELEVPLVLHPANTSMTYPLGLPLAIEVGTSWMWETSAAALSLIFSGALDECPSLRVLHPHMGGVIPYLIGRIDSFMATWGQIAPVKLERPLREYLRERFATDTASRTPAALAATIEVYGLENIMFSTDFPHPTCLYPKPLETVAEKMSTLTPTAQRKILGENAAKLYRL